MVLSRAPQPPLPHIPAAFILSGYRVLKLSHPKHPDNPKLKALMPQHYNTIGKTPPYSWGASNASTQSVPDHSTQNTPTNSPAPAAQRRPAFSPTRAQYPNHPATGIAPNLNPNLAPTASPDPNLAIHDYLRRSSQPRHGVFPSTLYLTPPYNYAMNPGLYTIVLDVDVKHPKGLPSYLALATTHPELQPQNSPNITITPSGGFHLYFCHSTPAPIQPHPIRRTHHRYPGIDFLHGNKLAIIAPSEHPKPKDPNYPNYDTLHMASAPPPPDFTTKPTAKTFLAWLEVLRTNQTTHTYTPTRTHTPSLEALVAPQYDMRPFTPFPKTLTDELIAPDTHSILTSLYDSQKTTLEQQYATKSLAPNPNNPDSYPGLTFPRNLLPEFNQREQDIADYITSLTYAAEHAEPGERNNTGFRCATLGFEYGFHPSRVFDTVLQYYNDALSEPQEAQEVTAYCQSALQKAKDGHILFGWKSSSPIAKDVSEQLRKQQQREQFGEVLKRHNHKTTKTDTPK